MKQLDDETYRKLVETTAQADHNGCCGCMRCGFAAGVNHALHNLGFKLDTEQFHIDVMNRTNELWEKEHPDE